MTNALILFVLMFIIGYRTDVLYSIEPFCFCLLYI